MSSGLNMVQIIGNLTKDPEMRYTPGGAAVTNFSVAVSGIGNDATEYFDVVAWEKLAETCNQYLHKGSKVYVQGRQQTRTWDGNDGQSHRRSELKAAVMTMLDPHPNREEF